jgi:hypothetical protein
MKRERYPVVSTRLPGPLYRVMREYLKIDGHVSEADLLRDALREFFERKFPQLYQKFIQPGKVR